MDYLRDKKINIHRLVLDSPNIYAHKTREGQANWDILASPPDTTATDTARDDTAHLAEEIDVRRVVLRHAVLTYDDRETRVFANLWDMNLDLRANLRRGHSCLHWTGATRTSYTGKTANWWPTVWLRTSAPTWS